MSGLFQKPLRREALLNRCTTSNIVVSSALRRDDGSLDDLALVSGNAVYSAGSGLKSCVNKPLSKKQLTAELHLSKVKTKHGVGPMAATAGGWKGCTRVVLSLPSQLSKCCSHTAWRRAVPRTHIRRSLSRRSLFFSTWVCFAMVSKPNLLLSSSA